MSVKRARTPHGGPAAQKVLAAATELFARHGFHTGVDTITAASGATKPTLYYSFDSKDGLAAAALRNAHQQWESDTKPDTRSTPDEAFRALTTPKALDRETLFVRALFELDDRSPLALAAAQEHHRAVTELLTACAERAEAPDPRSTARQLLLLLHGAVAQIRGGQTPRTAGRDARNAAEAVLDR